MKRMLLCIFWIGVPLFTIGMVAISLAIAGVEWAHDLIVWTMIPGAVAGVIGSLAFSKSGAERARRGFDMVQPDERRAG